MRWRVDGHPLDLTIMKILWLMLYHSENALLSERCGGEEKEGAGVTWDSHPN